MKKVVLLFCLAFTIVLIGCKSPIILVEGEPTVIKGEEVVEVQFTYDNLRIGNEPEDEYVKRRMQEFEDDGKDGQEWHDAWLRDRTDRFEPRFIELANNYTEEKFGLVFKKDQDDTRYIVKVNTYFTEPGFYTYVRNKPAAVGLNITILERNNPDTPVAVFDMPEIEGIVTPDVGTRITSAYRFAGRIFGSEMTKYIR